MHVLSLLTSAAASCLLLLVGLWCWIQWKHRRLIRAAANIQTVFPTLPIIGNLHYLLLGTDKLTSMMIDEGYNLGQRGILTSCFWLGPYPLIAIHKVEDIQSVLTSTKAMEKGSEMEHFEFAFKKGLLTAPANIWKITRRALDPVFHPRNLTFMMPRFNSNSREFVSRLVEYEGQGPVDVFPLIIAPSLQSICHLIFGPELEFVTTSEEFNKLISVVKSVPFLVTKKILFFWLQYDIIFRFLCGKDLQIIDSCWNSFAKTPLKVTRENNANKEFHKNCLSESDSNKDIIPEGPENLISLYSKLQQNYPEFTEEDLKAEMITLFCAGTDTVTTAISSCLLLLAYHQDIQDKLYEEILSVVDLERDVTDDDIRRMTYLDQVFKETLRWSFVIPMISRQPSEDIKLSDFIIPSGYTIFVGIAGPFMNPNIFPDPKRFDPERFSPENSKQWSRFAFLPFSGGPRNCIGKAYSNLLAKTMVIQVLRRFRLSTPMDVYNMKKKINVFAMSAEGYKISLEPRTS